MTHDANPTFDCEIRVRYDECDPMGFVHHANYFRYFELCRTEMLRSTGMTYREVEEQGEFVVVVQADVKYRIPARYDDVLQVHLEITKFGRAKVEHQYTLRRGHEVLNEAKLVLAAIDSNGNVQPIPDWMHFRVPERS